MEENSGDSYDIDELWPDEIELGAMLRGHYRQFPSPEVMSAHLLELRQAAEVERTAVASGDRFSRTVLLTSVAACLLLATLFLVGPLRERTATGDDKSIVDSPAAGIDAPAEVSTPGPESGGEGQSQGQSTTPVTGRFESESNADLELGATEIRAEAPANPVVETQTQTRDPVSTTVTAPPAPAAPESTSATSTTLSQPSTSASTTPASTQPATTAEPTTTLASTTTVQPTTAAPTTRLTTTAPPTTQPTTTAPPTTQPTTTAPPTTQPTTTAPPTTQSPSLICVLLPLLCL